MQESWLLVERYAGDQFLHKVNVVMNKANSEGCLLLTIHCCQRSSIGQEEVCQLELTFYLGLVIFFFLLIGLLRNPPLHIWESVLRFGKVVKRSLLVNVSNVGIGPFLKQVFYKVNRSVIEIHKGKSEQSPALLIFAVYVNLGFLKEQLNNSFVVLQHCNVNWGNTP